MKNEEFEMLLNDSLEAIRQTLSSKAKEYAMGDRLYNFKRAAEIARCSPAQALKGMLLKHLVSIFDLIEGNLENTALMVNEKVGDGINYLILLKAVLQEARAIGGRDDRDCDFCMYASLLIHESPCNTCDDGNSEFVRNEIYTK